MDKIAKKKILYFIPEFPRLTETFIEREVRKLIELGNLDIRVFSLQKASGKASDGVIGITDYRRLNMHACYKALGYLFKNTHSVLSAWNLVKRDSSHNFASRLYLFLKSLGYTYLIEQFHPDHIHVHFLSDPSTVVMIASEILRIPFSISGHARDVFVEGTLLKEKAEKAKFITICNTYAYDKFVSVAGGESLNKVRKLYHGVEITEHGSDEDKVEGQRPIILSVARLVEKKGLKYLIEASAILKKSCVVHEVHIIGPGPLYEGLVDLIKKKELVDTVYIDGKGSGLPHDEVSRFYAKADIFVLPSIETGEGDADGVPTVVIEAAMHRIPVIATEAGSMKDLIEHGHTGIIVPQRDPVAIATEIERLLGDPVLRIKLGEVASLRAGKLFDIGENISKLEILLLEG